MGGRWTLKAAKPILILAASMMLACTLSTLSVNTARFELVTGQGLARETLVRLDAARGTSVGLAEAQLSGARQVCIQDLEGRIERQGYEHQDGTPDIRTEAHVYF